MHKEETERQLKLSKRQNKDERYDYLDSEFNAINYCIKLEKYTNKLLQENKQVKDKYENIISRYKFIKNRVKQGMIEKYKNECLIELGNNILQELEKGGINEY